MKVEIWSYKSYLFLILDDYRLLTPNFQFQFSSPKSINIPLLIQLTVNFEAHPGIGGSILELFLRKGRGLPVGRLRAFRNTETQQQARQLIDEIHARGKRAILAGGSGLYVRAALDVLDFPGTDPQLKDEVVMLGGHLDSWHRSEVIAVAA